MSNNNTSKSIESFESLDLKNTETSQFKNMYDDYTFRNGKVDYLLLLLEIKSEFPPTDCTLRIGHSYQTNNLVKYPTIHFMNYRKDFIYENGLYIMYFDKIKEIEKDIILLDCRFENKRDPNSTAKLFYKTIFLSN